MTQLGHAVALALRAENTLRKLPRRWFDAACDWEEEVERLEYEVNSDRAEARTLRKLR